MANSFHRSFYFLTCADSEGQVSLQDTSQLGLEADLCYPFKH